MMLNYAVQLIIAGLILTMTTGCGLYSFTGDNIAPEVNTISIDYFANRAPQVQPSLSQKFTEQLKDKFVNQTKLTLVQNNGDLHFSGYIVDYRTQPVAIQSTDIAALNRLTITVNIEFENKYDETQNFKSNFSRFADYNSSEVLTSVEEQLIDDINEQLVDDIFNKAVINW